MGRCRSAAVAPEWLTPVGSSAEIHRVACFREPVVRIICSGCMRQRLIFPTHHNNCSHCSTARLHTWHSRSVRTSGPFPPSSEHLKEEAVPYDWSRNRQTQPGRCRLRSRDLGSRCCSLGRNGRRNCSSGNSSRAG